MQHPAVPDHGPFASNLGTKGVVMRYLWVVTCCVAIGCARGSDDPMPFSDAGKDAAVDAAPLCGPGACGAFVAPSGEAINCGACPSGQVCGDNGQPNVCGEACQPRQDPVACDNMLAGYGDAPDQLLEYSLQCRTDPPIDQTNCVMWQIWVPPGPGPCVDCDMVFCCVPPFVGEGSDGGGVVLTSTIQQARVDLKAHLESAECLTDERCLRAKTLVEQVRDRFNGL